MKKIEPLNLPNRSRRRFCAGGVALAAPALILPRWARANIAARTLAFDHTHTGEKLSLVYARDTRYLPGALQTLNHFLRDFRTGDIHVIDPQLFDLLFRLTQITATRAPFQVISAYRSPVTNRNLRLHSSGIASHSLHLEGRAIDVRLADVALADLRDAALSMAAGGVGYYPESDFVHIDTGRVRRW